MPRFAKYTSNSDGAEATVTAVCQDGGGDGGEAGFEIAAPPEVLATPKRLSGPWRRKPKLILVASVGICLIVGIVLLATLLPSGGAAGNGGSTNSSLEAVSSSSAEESRQHEEAEEAYETSANTNTNISSTASSAAPPKWNFLQDFPELTFPDEQGVQRTCDWLQNQISVDFDAAIGTYCHPPTGERLPLSAVMCPATCLRVTPAECEDSTALVPVLSPSMTQTLEDSRTHETITQIMEEGEPRECSWFGDDDARISEHCSADLGISTRADAACPRTCGKCPAESVETVFLQPTPPPTREPSAVRAENVAPLFGCPTIPYTSHDEDDVIRFRRDGKPDRYFRIYTPESFFNPTQPTKIVFIYHGWATGTFCRGRNFLSSEWRDVADEHGYVLVAVDGLAENDSDAPRSFTFPGSSDGVGRDGQTATTCNTQQRGPDYCYPSCERQGRCSNNRCSWTHCLDDDIQLFVDLVDEVANKYVCIDRTRVYAYGYSMGGMFTWSLAQDPRSSPLITGIGAAMGLPMHDYLVGKGDSSNIPAIGIYGDSDCIVPPGDGTSVYNEGCDGDGYRYVDAFHQHKLWAQEHGCAVGDKHPAKFEYKIDGRDEVKCASHCDSAAGPPMSVDCRSDADHGKRSWHLDIVLKFFEHHWLQQSNK